MYKRQSHTHGDHFNPSITEFDGPQTRYICHQDVPLEGKVKKCITMRPGQDALLDDVGIHMYGSTDEGGSFYVKTNTANIDSDSIFHAGDLNLSLIHILKASMNFANLRKSNKILVRLLS